MLPENGLKRFKQEQAADQYVLQFDLFYLLSANSPGECTPDLEDCSGYVGMDG